MTLLTEAWLEIDDGDGTTAQFQLQVNLEESSEMEKTFIMSGRGQYIKEIFDQIVSDEAIDIKDQPRAGYTIDGGAGEEVITVTVETGLEDVTWGDGSGGTGPSNVTKTDASGADVKPVVRKQVLEYWIRRTRTDSFGQARLHWGEWTDGTVGGVSAGIYEQPIPVAITGYNTESPDPEQTQASMKATITMARVALFPTDSIPDWVVDGAAKIQNIIDGVNDG